MKKNISLVVLLLLFIQHVMAQFDMESFKTPAQRMVENAVKPALFIVHSSFQIRNNESGRLYGRNGQNVFGEQISYGIKIKDGFLLSENAVHPWAYDAEFMAYKKEYTPILSSLQYSDFKDVNRIDSLDVRLENPVSLCDSFFYFYNCDFFNAKGLYVDKSIGVKSGWLLWITVPEKTDKKKSINPVVVVQQKNIEISNSQITFEVSTPKTDGEIIGGIFVAPQYNEVGSINFSLIGALKADNNGWVLLCPFGNLKNNEKALDAGLTPIED